MNKYQILETIDSGAYGIVQKAMNKQTNTLVAIKKFKELQNDDIVKKTIQRQIKMLNLLRGEYVVQLKQAFKKKGRTYLIFQYMEQNVLNLIEASPNGLESNIIQQIIYQIIKSLNFLHCKNIVHRDIKPQNLLITKKSSIFKLKLCDLGFTRYLPIDPLERMTDYIATRWYRSPQLLLLQNYGKGMDIWAVGCIMGELFDGQPMFPGDDEYDQINLIRKTFGKICSNQQLMLKKNQRFSDLSFPDIKFPQPLQMKYAGKITKTELNFLKCCLKLDPNERINTENALKHPYLADLVARDQKLKTEQYNRLTTKMYSEMKQESLQKKSHGKSLSKQKSPKILKNKKLEATKILQDHKIKKINKKSILRQRIQKQFEKNSKKLHMPTNEHHQLQKIMDMNLKLKLNIRKQSLPKITKNFSINNKSNSQPMILINKFKANQLKTIYNQPFDFSIIGKSQSIAKSKIPKI